MANLVEFKGCNNVISANSEDIQDLVCFNNGIATVSAWELRPEEIAEVMKSGRVYLAVLHGKTSPPVFVGSEDSVRAVVADYGHVWKR